MRIKIRKNKHYPCPSLFWIIPIPKFVSKKHNTVMSYYFKFTDTCLFNLHDEDQWDVNKLFGFSIGHHHVTSFRFGWRPILKKSKIEIVGYEYHDSFRMKTMILDHVKINTWNKYMLKYNPITCETRYYINNNLIHVNNFNLEKKHGWGYKLNVYFGGNEKAPQDIIIFRKKY